MKVEVDLLDSFVGLLDNRPETSISNLPRRHTPLVLERPEFVVRRLITAAKLLRIQEDALFKGTETAEEMLMYDVVVGGTTNLTRTMVGKIEI